MAHVDLGTRLSEFHTSTVCSMSSFLIQFGLVAQKFSYSLTTMSSWTGRRGREGVLTLLMPGFSSSEKHESSITESGEAVIGRLGCSENRRGEPLDSVCQ